MGTKAKLTGDAQGAAPATLEEALVVITNLTKDNNHLTDHLDQMKATNKGLVDAEKAGKTKIASLTSSLDDSKTVIVDLKNKLKEAKAEAAAGSKKLIVEVDGVKYQVNHGAGGIGSAEELAADPEKARKVIAKNGQNALTPVK